MANSVDPDQTLSDLALHCLLRPVCPTASLRLLKNKFHGTVLCLISLNDPSDRVYVWCAGHSLYTRNSLDPQDTEAWKYYNLRFKQTSTKNSCPGSLYIYIYTPILPNYHTYPYSAPSSNSAVFKLQPGYFLSTSL